MHRLSPPNPTLLRLFPCLVITMGGQRLAFMQQHTVSRVVRVALVLLLGLVTASARGQDEPLPPGGNPMCPVMQDQPAKASRFVDYQGRRIYFCCDKCVAKFARDPAKYLAVPDAQLASVKPQPTSETLVATTAPATAPANDITSARPFGSKPWQLLGKLHVVVVHFPIALIILAGLIELPRMRKNSISETGYLCLMLGAVATVVAASMGWVNAANAFEGSTTVPRALALHRWTGVSLAAFVCVIATLMTFSRREAVTTPALLRTSRFGAALCAVLVAVVGHFGGTL